MKLLITGIALCILPILTWFGAGFVEAAGTTIFFWVIGIPMILIGADRITPGGIWKTKSIGGSSGGTEYERHRHYDADGKETGYTDVPKK